MDIRYRPMSRQTLLEQCFFVLYHCLGEYRTATEIGEIEFAALSKAGLNAKTINSLAREFE